MLRGAHRLFMTNASKKSNPQTVRRIRTVAIGTTVALSAYILTRPISFFNDSYYGIGRDTIANYFGKKMITQGMADFLAKDLKYIDSIPLKLRNEDVWKELYRINGFRGLYGLVTDGEKFSRIVGQPKTRDFVVASDAGIKPGEPDFWSYPMDRDMTQADLPGESYKIGSNIFTKDKESDPQNPSVNTFWGIRFMDMTQINHNCQHNPLSWFVPYEINRIPFLWRVEIPADALISVGCDHGPHHDLIDCFCCHGTDQRLASNKLNFVQRIKNPHYQPYTFGQDSEWMPWT